jgi:hypothetical protein
MFFIFLDPDVQLLSSDDPEGLKREVELASRSVRQLGALLFEMEVIKF